MQSFESAISNAYGTAFAVLNKRFQNVQQVEDALQVACIKAIDKWPTENIVNFKAWLIKVATNYILDELKKHKPDYVEHADTISPVEAAYQYDDATLGLLFTCCHPCISQENQLTLFLKWVMGFDNTSIARALLISDKTLEQRITRTKRKLRANKVDFTLPTQVHLPTRLNAVIKGLYLVFNEGYFGNSGHVLVSNTLCMQAIYLMRLVCRTFRGNAASLALLSLMLFIQARSPARATNKIILLSHQDRSKWNKLQIAEADVLLQKSLKLGRPTAYHIQAAIAGLHSQALSYQETDWPQIILLYDKLLTYEYSPVALLNQSVALMELGRWDIAEEKLISIQESLRSYAPYYIAFGYLYKHTHRIKEATRSLKSAYSLSKNASEKEYLQEQLKRLK
ncbi:RNA polymerase sigma factor [Thalassotalea sediminis]|uniref:RNA polymerase sigma factor n=1 Tax=Thalassotalea sediminis TaxID=1759089 RepID=UPI0025739FA2|nr:sigma-70 family RNA polymerase sigma factor [Thalassotalea sediminis]